MDELLVIGDIAIDILHLPDRSVTSAGGAGLYAAMAASRCGINVALFALRPDPLPGILSPLANRLNSYMGPRVSVEDLPLFEVSYRQEPGGFAKLRAGAGHTLTPDLLPEDLPHYGLLHVTPAGGPLWQLDMIKACRRRGARSISAGTFPCSSEEEAQTVRDVLEEVDVFFMNVGEAAAVFGSVDAAAAAPDRLLFITLGAGGVLVCEGEKCTHIPAAQTDVVDPTGAGDSFCGATLAYLLQGDAPVAAARRAAVLASRVIGQVGPSALY